MPPTPAFALPRETAKPAGISVSPIAIGLSAGRIGEHMIMSQPERHPPQRGPRGAGRRRRASGEPPPLLRQLGVSGRVWIALGASVPVVVGVLLADGALGVAFDRWDSAVLRQVAGIRGDWLTTS